MQVGVTVGCLNVNGCWTTESKNIRDDLVGEPVNGSCEVLLEAVVGD